MPETLNYQNRAIAYSVLAHIYDKGTLAHGPLDIFIPIVKNALSELYPLGVVKGNSMKEITDAKKEVYSSSMDVTAAGQVTSFSIADLTPGTYVLEFTNAAGGYVYGQFIVE